MKQYKFLYRRARIEQPAIFGEKAEVVAGPAGTGHIFTFTRDKDTGNTILNAAAMCGRPAEALDLGEDPFVYAARVHTLPICRACLEAWKADPDGPYARWIHNLEPRK